MELSQPRLHTYQSHFMIIPLRQIGRLLDYLSLICYKTALLLHENNKFDILKKKIAEDSTKQLLEEQGTILFIIPSFILLVYAHDELN